jgi:hypothetical protein
MHIATVLLERLARLFCFGGIGGVENFLVFHGVLLRAAALGKAIRNKLICIPGSSTNGSRGKNRSQIYSSLRTFRQG